MNSADFVELKPAHEMLFLTIPACCWPRADWAELEILACQGSAGGLIAEPTKNSTADRQHHIRNHGYRAHVRFRTHGGTAIEC
jgi:hypothetical protein